MGKYASIQEHIQNIERSIDNVYAMAEEQGRDLTRSEKAQIAELDAHLAELKGPTPKSLTFQGPDGTSAPGGRRPSGDEFKSFGEQLRAIMEAGRPGGRVDDRLYAAATGLNETTPSEGGFLVSPGFSTDLLTRIYQDSPLASRCTRYQVGPNSNGLVLPAVDETSRVTGSRQGGVRGYWLAEADEKTASKPKFRSIELSLKKVACLVYCTDELLADSQALETYVTSAMVAELSFMLEDAIMNGTGAGMPLGIMNAGCLVTQNKETGQAANTVVAENVLKMYSRLPARSRAASAWFINQSIEPELHKMSIAVGTGGQLIYMPSGGLSQSPYGTLLGRPVIPIEQCQTLGTAGDIILGDFSQYCLLERGAAEVAMSIHVRFVFDESVFRAVLRVDGQPSWSSTLTPYKGGASNAVSPFVVLQTRS